MLEIRNSAGFHLCEQGDVQAVPIASVTRLLETLTTTAFCRTLLQELNEWTRVDHCGLMRFSPQSGLQPFGAEHLPQFQVRGSGAAIAYVDHYHRHDPIRRLPASRLASRDSIMLGRRRQADIADRAHRRACYEEAGIIERLSLVNAQVDGGLLALTLFRQEESGCFSDRDIKTLLSVAPLFMTAALRHVSLTLNASSDAASWRLRLKIMAPAMTKRELDVASHLLAGKTLPEIGEALGIAHSTTVTYRERAYARLGVANLKELRGRFSIS